MDWLRWHFTQYKPVIFSAVLLAAVLAAYVMFPVNIQKAPAGFGPDWECTAQGQGGPTCIKKIRPEGDR